MLLLLSDVFRMLLSLMLWPRCSNNKVRAIALHCWELWRAGSDHNLEWTACSQSAHRM